jgi:hypothetical protein
MWQPEGIAKACALSGGFSPQRFPNGGERKAALGACCGETEPEKRKRWDSRRHHGVARLRGVGKTTLAATYAEAHRGPYRATWWIRAQAESTMRADLVALGIRPIARAWFN